MRYNLRSSNSFFSYSISIRRREKDERNIDCIKFKNFQLSYLNLKNKFAQIYIQYMFIKSSLCEEFTCNDSPRKRKNETYEICRKSKKGRKGKSGNLIETKLYFHGE